MCVQANCWIKFRLKNDVDLNHTIAFVDIFYIQNKPVLHVIYEETDYQAARWLPAVSEEQNWRALRLCWIDRYLEAPDGILQDAGINSMAQAFSYNRATFNIKLKAVRFEAPQPMSTKKQYPTPVCKAFCIIRSEASFLDDEVARQVAVKEINNIVVLNVLASTLLIYGAFPQLGLASNPPSPSLYQRARALRLAIKDATVYFAKSQVWNALKSTNGPQTLDLHKLLHSDHILVYRPNTDRREGRFALLDKRDEDSTILINHGLSKCRSTIFNPTCPPQSDNSQAQYSEQVTVHLLYKPQCNSLLCQISDRKYEQERCIQFAAGWQTEFNQAAFGKQSIRRCLITGRKRTTYSQSSIYRQNQNSGIPQPQAFEKSRQAFSCFKTTFHGFFKVHSNYASNFATRSTLYCSRVTWFNRFYRRLQRTYTQSETNLSCTVYINPPDYL